MNTSLVLFINFAKRSLLGKSFALKTAARIVVGSWGGRNLDEIVRNSYDYSLVACYEDTMSNEYTWQMAKG